VTSRPLALGDPGREAPDLRRDPTREQGEGFFCAPHGADLLPSSPRPSSQRPSNLAYHDLFTRLPRGETYSPMLYRDQPHKGREEKLCLCASYIGDGYRLRAESSN
jgi:hypothetical protein